MVLNQGKTAQAKARRSTFPETMAVPALSLDTGTTEGRTRSSRLVGFNLDTGVDTSRAEEDLSVFQAHMQDMIQEMVMQDCLRRVRQQEAELDAWLEGRPLHEQVRVEWGYDPVSGSNTYRVREWCEVSWAEMTRVLQGVTQPRSYLTRRNRSLALSGL